MKKIILIFLSIAMCISMYACGNSKKEIIAEKLELKSWTFKGLDKATYSFENGTCTKKRYLLTDDFQHYENIPEKSYYGSYIVTNFDGQKGEIFISYGLEKKRNDYDYKPVEKVIEQRLYFTFENNILRVFSNQKMTIELK